MTCQERIDLWKKQFESKNWSYEEIASNSIEIDTTDGVIIFITACEDHTDIKLRNICSFNSNDFGAFVVAANNFNKIMSDRHYFITDNSLNFAFTCPDSKIDIEYFIQVIYGNYCTVQAFKRNLGIG